MNQDPAKLSLSNFLAHETSDPLEPPPGFTHWMRQAKFAVELYEPELLASADARTTIDYNGRPRSVINLCSYNYLGLANHPEVIAAAQEALKTHGLGACGSPMLSGMTDLHRELERQVAKFLGREDAMLFNSGFGGALGTISGLLRKNDVAILDNRSHLSLRDGAALSRCRADKFEHNDPASLDKALARKQARRQLVVMEGIYSMDGDFGNLPALLDIAESHGASVFVDEAHSMLALRRTRSRRRGKIRCGSRIPLVYGTFSKHLARWADLWPARRRPFATCVFTRTRMFIRALCRRRGGGDFKSAGNRNARAGVAEKTLGERRLLSRATAQRWHRYRNVDNVHYAAGHRRPGTHVPVRSTSCDGAVCGSRRWITQRCRKTRFVSAPA
jgi:hypothetical protein